SSRLSSASGSSAASFFFVSFASASPSSALPSSSPSPASSPSPGPPSSPGPAPPPAFCSNFSLSFDGVAGQVSHASQASLQTGGPYTVSCWVKLASKQSGSIVCKYNGVAAQSEYLLWYLAGTDRFRLNADTSGGGTEDVVNANT